MKRLIATSLLLIAFPALSGPLYRCGNEYSQVPCGGQATEVKTIRTVSGHANGQEDESGGVCERDLKRWVTFMDPDSVKIESVAKPKAELIDFANTRLMAWNYVMYVNSKNSYGAYTGPKAYQCYTSQDRMRILKIVAPRG